VKHGHKRGTRDILADNVIEAIRSDDSPSTDRGHVAQVLLTGIDKTLYGMRERSKYRPWLERLRCRVLAEIDESKK
jgi:hypothetical protein